jgi:hypothetical protein
MQRTVITEASSKNFDDGKSLHHQLTKYEAIAGRLDNTIQVPHQNPQIIMTE